MSPTTTPSTPSSIVNLAGVRHEDITTNGIRLHTAIAGPEDGPLVILLHGFPELWFGWRKQIGPLADHGFRVYAPDQRGYNLSDRPAGVANYTLDKIAADVIGLIDASGRKTAQLVGHDWGAAAAWWTAHKYPDRIERMAILNVPHPLVMQQHIQGSLKQLMKSWYMFLFQLPILPELGLTVKRGDKMAKNLTDSSRPGTFNEEELEVYREAWTRPGAATTMINWYRAGMRNRLKEKEDQLRIKVPTLLIWGALDAYLGREMAKPSIDLCDDGRLVFIEEATHWVQHEEPERVNELLLEFLKR